MAYTRAMAIAFWQDFDTTFNKGPKNPVIAHDIADAIDKIQRIGLQSFSQIWRGAVYALRHGQPSAYPEGYRTMMLPFRDSFMLLANKQLEIMDNHFAGNSSDLRQAFEDFGQGLLFDDHNPREAGDEIHMMQNGAAKGPFQDWHAFTRATVFLGGDENRWLEIDRNVAMALVIQREAHPIPGHQNNPGLTAGQLSLIRNTWQSKSFDQLDAAFFDSIFQ